MARPREFDTQDVLNRAMAAFWHHGYESTSVNDLCAATGLKKGSLYQAFGDKHSLYLQVLQQYLQGSQMAMKAAIAPPTNVLAGLRAFLSPGTPSGTECGPRGCFAINATVELGPHDQHAAALVETHHSNIVAILAEAFQRGQDDGYIRSDQSADELARFIHVIFCGLAVQDRREERRDLASTMAFALEMLNP